jgi:hypothetical protein
MSACDTARQRDSVEPFLLARARLVPFPHGRVRRGQDLAASPDHARAAAQPRHHPPVRRGCRATLPREACPRSAARRRRLSGFPARTPLTAFDNVALPLRIMGHGRRDDPRQRWRDARLGRASAARRGRVHRPCRAASSSASRSPAPWSVAPDLIIADEPTGNVDPEMANRLLQLLERSTATARPCWSRRTMCLWYRASPRR